jgi:hypothetical protein
MVCCCVLQSLKQLSSVSEDQSSAALQLSAQVNFRLDKGRDSAEAYNKLKAAGLVSWLLVCVCVCVCGGGKWWGNGGIGGDSGWTRGMVAQLLKLRAAGLVGRRDVLW